MKAGQTLAIAGLVFTREEAVNRGIPWLADLPWVGLPFRRVSNTRNDVELLIFVTPEFCEAMDPNEVPPCGPGQLTTTPTDCELYCRGYLEVPKNCPDGNGGHGGLHRTGWARWHRAAAAGASDRRHAVADAAALAEQPAGAASRAGGPARSRRNRHRHDSPSGQHDPHRRPAAERLQLVLCERSGAETVVAAAAEPRSGRWGMTI